MEFLLSLPLLSIHVSSVMLTLALVVIADTHGLLWVLGKTQTLPAKRMHLLHTAVWIGLIVTVTAGFLMFSTYSEYLLSLTAFKLKIAFVVLLICNALVIGKHMDVATRVPFATLPKQERTLLIISGLISTTCWCGALIAAQFLS